MTYEQQIALCEAPISEAREAAELTHREIPYTVNRHYEIISQACQAYAKRVNADLTTRAERAEMLAALREASEDTAITRLGKVEKELTEHKLSIQIAEDNYAQLQQLRADVKPLLELLTKASQFKPSKPDYWSSCSQCEHYKDDAGDVMQAFLSAHLEFRKDETK